MNLLLEESYVESRRNETDAGATSLTSHEYNLNCDVHLKLL